MVESGLAGSLIQRLSRVDSPFFEGGDVIPEIPDNSTLRDVTFMEMDSRSASLALGVSLVPQTGHQDVEIIIITPDGDWEYKRSYGGHPRNAATWAGNIALELLRQELIK